MADLDKMSFEMLESVRTNPLTEILRHTTQQCQARLCPVTGCGRDFMRTFTLKQYFFNKTNNKFMKRKHYEKPSLEVVVLKQTGMLMTSGDEVLRTDYGDPIEDTWGEEEKLVLEP